MVSKQLVELHSSQRDDFYFHRARLLFIHYVLHTVGETFRLIFGMVRSQWDLCQQIFQTINFTRGYFRPRVFYFHRARLLFMHYVLHTVGETFRLIFGMVRSQWDLCQQVFYIIKTQPLFHLKPRFFIFVMILFCMFQNTVFYQHINKKSL